MPRYPPKSSGHLLKRRSWQLALLIMATALLQVAAAVGLSYVAGFSYVRQVLDGFDWPYLIAVLIGLALSFVGYYFAYRSIYRVEDGPDLTPLQLRTVVTAGFGGFLAHGGSALDAYALQGAGTSERESKVRVTCLGGMEHGTMSLIGDAAAIAVLAMGLSAPPLDFTLPWAVIPVPGFLIAFWAAERYRARLRDAPGWKGKLGIFLDAIHLTKELFRHPLRLAGGVLGMAGFWLAESLMGWASLAAFGFHMNVAQFIVGFYTGMVFTRRTGPLAGAGVLDLVLPVTVWYSGAPFATAVVGMFTYRFISLWVPMPFALSRLRPLREIGNRSVPGAEGRAEQSGEPGLRPQET